MKEFRTVLLGNKMDVGLRSVRPVSDWEMVEIYDDAGNFLIRGLVQNIPGMYGEVGFSDGKNSNRPLAPIGGDRKFHEPANIPWFSGFEIVPDIDTPAWDGDGSISGYLKD